MQNSLIRIVRLSFSPEKVNDFLEIFAYSQPFIAAFEGCSGVQLYKDHALENVFYTHSFWRSVEDLEKYRQSEFFQMTWAKTKLLFNDKPMAFSLLPA